MAEPETDGESTPGSQRKLRAREAGWAKRCSTRLVAAGVRPNTITTLGVLCAAGGSAALVALGLLRPELSPASAVLCYMLALLGIAGRLVSNLLDGMVADEGGQASAVGEIWNDLADRIADVLLLAAAGYAVGGPWGFSVGWGCAVVAVIAEYIREFGAARGAGQQFLGPMAKLARMYTLAVAFIGSAVATAVDADQIVLGTVLIVIGGGTALACLRRVRAITVALGRRA